MYKTFTDKYTESNTYVVYDGSGVAMIVDLGTPARGVVDFCRAEGLTVRYLVLTHAHFDHAEYIDEYRAAFPEADVLAHRNEVVVMTEPRANMSAVTGCRRSYGTPTVELAEGDVITLGGDEYRVLLTPGHTPGSICLYSEKQKLMLTGDTLFEGAHGRTDFMFGSDEDMRASLRRLFAMDPEITILPGHYGTSKIGDEKGRVF